MHATMVKEMRADASSTRIADTDRAEMWLTMCAWCERVSLDDRWVEPAVAVRKLRTFEWPSPPSFTHGICPTCLEQLTGRRSRAESAVARGGEVLAPQPEGRVVRG